MTITNDQGMEMSSHERELTRRLTIPAMEDMLHHPFNVLDHGFLRVVDYMGGDAAVVQAARVSYGRGTKKPSEDAGLIAYLMRHWHTTPFEMCSIKLHVKLPIFVARQWIRHRAASANEYSARYSILDREFYVPAVNRIAVQSSTNRQGSGAVLEPEEAYATIDMLRGSANDAFDTYDWLLNAEDPDESGPPHDANRQGVARELARISLPLSSYTQFYWKVDVKNLLDFLRLRADRHAQHEIRVYADVLLAIVKRWVPLTFEAFEEHRLHSLTLSRSEVAFVRKLLAAGPAVERPMTMKNREWESLTDALGIVRAPPATF